MTLDFAEICLLKNHIIEKLASEFGIPVKATSNDNLAINYPSYMAMHVSCTIRRRGPYQEFYVFVRVSNYNGFCKYLCEIENQDEADRHIEQIVKLVNHGC